MHASDSPRPTRSPAALTTATTRPGPSRPSPSSRSRHWGRVLASGLAVCLLLSACGGDDNNGSEGQAREVRCAR